MAVSTFGIAGTSTMFALAAFFGALGGGVAGTSAVAARHAPTSRHVRRGASVGKCGHVRGPRLSSRQLPSPRIATVLASDECESVGGT